MLLTGTLKIVGTRSSLLLIAFFCALGVFGCRQGDNAAVAILHRGDRIDIVNASGKVLRSRIIGRKDLEEVSMDRDAAYGAGIVGRCYDRAGGDLYELPNDGGAARRIDIGDLLPPSSPELKLFDREIRVEPAVSPDGETIAFAVRPCGTTHDLDLVESYGVIGVYERKSGKARALPGSQTPAGAPIAYANLPEWSDDGKKLLVRFEIGFTVLRMPEGNSIAENPSPQPDNLTLGLGWLGSRCVIYVEGKDFDAALQGERKAFNVETKEIRALAEVLKAWGEPASRLSSFRWPYATVVGDSRTFWILGESGKVTKQVTDEGVHLLPISSGVVPEFCR